MNLSPTHLDLILRIAKRILRRLPQSVELGDLVNDGFIGLHTAFGRFDASRGVAFETFAARWIRGSILDGLRKRDWMPRQIRAGSDAKFLPLLYDPAEPSSRLENIAELEWIARAIKNQPRRTRLIFQLYYQEGLSLREIAGCLGLTEARISKLRSQTINQLRKTHSAVEPRREAERFNLQNPKRSAPRRGSTNLQGRTNHR